MLAAAPITWGECELPNWGAVPPYRDVLDQMASLGFHGTELGSPGFLPRNPGVLRAELHERAIQLVGAFCPLPLSDADGGRSALERSVTLARLLAEAGCTILVAADEGDDRRRATAGRVRPEHGLRDAQWRAAGDCLASLAERCAPLGVRVVFHPHAGSYVETAAELDALMAATPVGEIGLCLDTGHIVYGGGDPLDVARRYSERVWHVHLKDVSGAVLGRVRDAGLDYAAAVGEGVFTPLGDGTIDFGVLVAELRGAGYAGWWVLEQDVRLGTLWPAQDPLRNATRSLSFLASLGVS